MTAKCRLLHFDSDKHCENSAFAVEPMLLNFEDKKIKNVIRKGYLFKVQ